MQVVRLQRRVEACRGHTTSFGHGLAIDLGTGRSGLHSDETDVTAVLDSSSPVSWDGRAVTTGDARRDV